MYHSYTHSPQPHLPRTPHQHCRHPRTLTLSQHIHMQHKQQYKHHRHRNNRTHNIGYYDNLTNRPRTTTGLLTPHKHTDPAVDVREISSYCKSTLTDSETNSRNSNCLFTTHMQTSSQFRKPSSPLKPKHPKYITSQQCAPIGCTRQEVGSSHSLETTLHSLQQTYLRLLIYTTQNFKWSRYTLTTLNISQ